MTNLAGVQEPSKDGTITISAPVPVALDRKVRIAVAERGLRSKAEAIRQALTLWLVAPACPQCDRAMTPHPDLAMVGVWFCPFCQEAVGFEQ